MRKKKTRWKTNKRKNRQKERERFIGDLRTDFGAHALSTKGKTPLRRLKKGHHAVAADMALSGRERNYSNVQSCKKKKKN